MAMANNNDLDYLNAKEYCTQIGETVELSTKIFKINKRGKKQERIFILTNRAIYNIKPIRSKSDVIYIKIKNNTISCQRRINLADIASITITTSSPQFTINIPSEYDYRYEAFDLLHMKEIVRTINRVCKNKQNCITSLSIHKINQYSTAQFTVTKNDNKSVASMKRNTLKIQPMVILSKNSGDTETTSQMIREITTEAKTADVVEQIPQKTESETPKTDTNGCYVGGEIMHCSEVTAPQFVDCVQIGTNKIDIKEYKSDDDIDGIITSEIQHIQTETKAMEASTYYDLLIHGYMRQIEHDLKLIPDDIKALCIAFHYKFLVYNEYCSVKYKRKYDAPRLLIETHSIDNEIPFGARLVSQVPINANNDGTYDKSKVCMKVHHTFTNDLCHNGEFSCVAINDYYASVTDELDLRTDAEYIIMQTSPSGWWYAVNSDGEDGWVPSNYLKVLPKNGQLVFGITTDPELFINAMKGEDPFLSENAKHVIYRRGENIVERVGDQEETTTTANWGIEDGDKLDIWIENNQLKIKDTACILLERDLLMDCNGFCMNYYFVVAFTVKCDQNSVSLEISGEFV